MSNEKSTPNKNLVKDKIYCPSLGSNKPTSTEVYDSLGHINWQITLSCIRPLMYLNKIDFLKLYTQDQHILLLKKAI